MAQLRILLLHLGGIQSEHKDTLINCTEAGPLVCRPRLQHWHSLHSECWWFFAGKLQNCTGIHCTWMAGAVDRVRAGQCSTAQHMGEYRLCTEVRSVVCIQLPTQRIWMLFLYRSTRNAGSVITCGAPSMFGR